MQGEDLDTYIATFDHLREVAQWERDSWGTILLFRRGLNPALAQAIINRTIPRPVTFDDWANAAQTQHANWIKSHAVMGTQSHGRNNGFRNPRWQQAISGTENQSRHDEVIPMDINLVELGRGRLSEAERKRLQTKGRCFFYKAQGHMSHQCSKKGGCTGNTQNLNCPQPITTQTTEVDEDTPVSANAVAMTPDRKAVLKGILGMSTEERTQLLDELILNDQPSSSF